MSRKLRWSLIALALAAALAVGVYFAYRVALGELRTRVLEALGTQSEIGEIVVSFKDITITELKINAPSGWPVQHALSASRVVITPDLGSLFAGVFRVNRITIERAYLAVLRDRTGKLRVLPSLTEKAVHAGAPGAVTAPSTAVLIELIELKNTAVSFFDMDVRSPPHQVKFERTTAKVTNLRVPALTGRSEIDVNATVIGIAQNGTLAVQGQMEFATRDGEIKTTLRGVEVAALEPYLLRAAETGVRKGTLDLDLAAKVAAQRLTAPGRLVLNGLELRPSTTTAGTFMGMPRDTVINLIRERDGRIEVPFTLEGNLADPRFSLDSAFKAKLGIATAAALGVTISGLVKDLGGWREKGALKEKADAALESLKRILGR